jgi:hypothetical protein
MGQNIGSQTTRREILTLKWPSYFTDGVEARLICQHDALSSMLSPLFPTGPAPLICRHTSQIWVTGDLRTIASIQFGRVARSRQVYIYVMETLLII